MSIPLPRPGKKKVDTPLRGEPRRGHRIGFQRVCSSRSPLILTPAFRKPYLPSALFSLSTKPKQVGQKSEKRQRRCRKGDAICFSEHQQKTEESLDDPAPSSKGRKPPPAHGELAALVGTHSLQEGLASSPGRSHGHS